MDCHPAKRPGEPEHMWGPSRLVETPITRGPLFLPGGGVPWELCPREMCSQHLSGCVRCPWDPLAPSSVLISLPEPSEEECCPQSPLHECLSGGQRLGRVGPGCARTFRSCEPHDVELDLLQGHLEESAPWMKTSRPTRFSLWQLLTHPEGSPELLAELPGCQPGPPPDRRHVSGKI